MQWHKRLVKMIHTWVLSLQSGVDQFHLPVQPSPEHTSYTPNRTTTDRWLENDAWPQNRGEGWIMQDWKTTDKVTGWTLMDEITGVDNAELDNSGLENVGLENEGLDIDRQTMTDEKWTGQWRTGKWQTKYNVRCYVCITKMPHSN